MLTTFAKKVIVSLKKGERRYAVSAFCFLAILGTVFTFVFAGARLVYKINYSGKDIAIVEKKETFNSAKKDVVKLVNGFNVEEAVEKPQFTTVMALDNSINNKQEVVDAIIENTDGIVMGYSVKINGIEVFEANKALFDKCMDAYFDKFAVAGADCTFEFVEDVQLDIGYCLKKDIATKKEINDCLQTLSVKTIARQTVETVIPYEVTKIKDENLLIGTRDVIIKGVNGKGKTVTTTVYINGIQIGEAAVSNEIVTAPVNEAVNIGTAIPNYYGEVNAIDGSGYMFPLPRGSYNYTAPFGDGRGHKGIDLCAAAGTPIMAVSGGKVIRSEWYEGFGNCVEIDHGFGFVTRYAHASELLVSYGQTVEAGQTIALVGSTGDSTGSHLHIEFIINGTRYDPAMYLGLE